MMAPYLGTRIILAEPLSNAEFNTMVNGEKAEPVKEVMEGHTVVYPDGYRNWYPKATFEFLYRGFSQGEANFFNPPKPEEKPEEENPSKSNLKIEKDE
jgi:hypothetical protein